MSQATGPLPALPPLLLGLESHWFRGGQAKVQFQCEFDIIYAYALEGSRGGAGDLMDRAFLKQTRLLRADDRRRES
jgi:hypothetical protein